ncbi:MAG: hypothetical protein SWX82_27770 [Cyanobacteriota bacterium]|nr:hypothetical protein [Cyanobacteriota bacterium]
MKKAEGRRKKAEGRRQKAEGKIAWGIVNDRSLCVYKPQTSLITNE